MPQPTITSSLPLKRTLFPVPGSSELVEIRTPLDRPLWSAVAGALAALPPDKVGAVVRVAKTAQGIDTVVAFKIGDRWSVAGGWHRGGAEGDVVGAQVVFSR